MLAATVKAPAIDYAALSPLIALAVGAVVVLLCGLVKDRVAAYLVPTLTLAAFGTAVGLTIWQWNTDTSAISGALKIDGLALVLGLLFYAGGIAATVLSVHRQAPAQAGHGEYYALLLSAALGMGVLVAAQNTVALFVGIELLSISLYILCASEIKNSSSLESGLKYLIVGSIGSATLLYGLALLYGATGSTDFGPIEHAIAAGGIAGDPLLLGGIALITVGLAFKASIAPFHQWTPDVYEGAPTPITAFMSVATKAAAFGVLLRLFDVALLPTVDDWAPLLAALAAITIVVGNVGALGQSSLKRILAFSSIAQAGYMLAGVVVATELGVTTTVFYLIAYLLMNVAAFAVIIAREHDGPHGDELRTLNGLGRERPLLAWSMTIAMLALAGLPATSGFIGKIYLIDAAASGGYTWLGIMIVVGSAISLTYYLRVVAAIWIDGESGIPDLGRVGGAGAAGFRACADARQTGDRTRERAAGVLPVTVVAVIAATATVFFGLVASPLVELAEKAGRALF